MPGTDKKQPKSYDDIIRQTVVDQDLSARPSKEQERQAREGFRALDQDEQALQDRVQQAVAGAGAGAAGVKVEITRELVTLTGQVADVALLRTIEDAVAGVPGVDTVHNQIVVAAS